MDCIVVAKYMLVMYAVMNLPISETGEFIDKRSDCQLFKDSVP
jgi:hypothetical protein